MRRRDAPARHTDGALRETQTGLTNCSHEPAHVAMPTQAGATTQGLSSRVPGDGDGRYLPHLEHRRKRGNASLARRQNGTETHHRSNYERLRRFPAPRVWLSHQSSLARALRSSSSSSSVSYPFSSRARRASSRVPICRRRSASILVVVKPSSATVHLEFKRTERQCGVASDVRIGRLHDDTARNHRPRDAEAWRRCGAHSSRSSRSTTISPVEMSWSGGDGPAVGGPNTS